MNEKIEMIGYHGTCSKYMENIKKYGLDPDKTHKRMDHWLGQGVYFFEDYNLAKWWANDISGKSYNQGTFPVVYQATICANKEEILDLDKRKEYDLFIGRIMEIQNELEKDVKKGIPVFDREQLRAIYFDYYKQQYQISVISFTFSKDYAKYGTFRNKTELSRQKQLGRALGLAYHEKQICVSKKECIKNRQVRYNGEDEVI